MPSRLYVILDRFVLMKEKGADRSLRLDNLAS